MKTEASKRNNSVITIILAVVMVLLCLFTAFTVMPAKAEGDSDTPTDTEGGDTPADPPDAYYFSDYEGSVQLCSDLITNGIVNAIERKYWQHDVFEDQFKSAFNDGEFDDISDTHVIFEIRYGFNMEIQSDLNFVFVLRDFFSDLKSKNCQIMFICGTDEALFNCSDEYTEFLDYVDIHVNTDIMSVFFSSLLIREKQKCNGGQEFKDCTIILDNNFAPNIDIDDSAVNNESSKWYCWSLKYRIFPFISRIWNVPLDSFGIYVQFLNQKNIKILCHLYDNLFYDFNNDTVVNADEADTFYNDYMNGVNVFAIGGTWGDEQYSWDWINWMQSLRSLRIDFGEDGTIPDDFFSIYVYNTNGFYTEEYAPEYVFTSGDVDKQALYDIVVDFLRDGDLTQYNNYNGRCVVSHKLIRYSEDGWMTYLLQEYACYFLPSWCSFMNESDYMFHFGAYETF